MSLARDTLDLDRLRASVADLGATDDEIADVLETWADRQHLLATTQGACWWWERLNRRDLYRRTAAALRRIG